VKYALLVVFCMTLDGYVGLSEALRGQMQSVTWQSDLGPDRQTPILPGVYTMWFLNGVRKSALCFDEAVANGIAHDIDRGFEAQLLENVAAVGLHGTRADDQFLGDLLVGQPAHKQEHHLALAL
jgi:hypothetical protein